MVTLEDKKKFLRRYGYNQEGLDRASEERINQLYDINKDEEIGEVIWRDDE